MSLALSQVRVDSLLGASCPGCEVRVDQGESPGCELTCYHDIIVSVSQTVTITIYWQNGYTE